jgi:hypothetical protein
MFTARILFLLTLLIGSAYSQTKQKQGDQPPVQNPVSVPVQSVVPPVVTVKLEPPSTNAKWYDELPPGILQGVVGGLIAIFGVWLTNRKHQSEAEKSRAHSQDEAEKNRAHSASEAEKNRANELLKLERERKEAVRRKALEDVVDQAYAILEEMVGVIVDANTPSESDSNEEEHSSAESDTGAVDNTAVDEEGDRMPEPSPARKGAILQRIPVFLSSMNKASLYISGPMNEQMKETVYSCRSIALEFISADGDDHLGRYGGKLREFVVLCRAYLGYDDISMKAAPNGMDDSN